MTRRLAILVTLVTFVGFGAASCSSTSPSSGSFFNWSVDSRSYQAAPLGLTYSNDSQNTFSGFTCNLGQSATITTPNLSGKFHSGTYHSPGATGSDAFDLVINEGLPDQTGAVPSWVASAGSMTVTAVDGSHIAGSFDVTLVPNANSNETGTAHGTGSFDVPPFTSPGGVICVGSAVR